MGNLQIRPSGPNAPASSGKGLALLCGHMCSARPLGDTRGVPRSRPARRGLQLGSFLRMMVVVDLTDTYNLFSSPGKQKEGASS